jgi:hypothetical protein
MRWGASDRSFSFFPKIYNEDRFLLRSQVTELGYCSLRRLVAMSPPLPQITLRGPACPQAPPLGRLEAYA